MTTRGVFLLVVRVVQYSPSPLLVVFVSFCAVAAAAVGGGAAAAGAI